MDYGDRSLNRVLGKFSSSVSLFKGKIGESQIHYDYYRLNDRTKIWEVYDCICVFAHCIYIGRLS